MRKCCHNIEYDAIFESKSCSVFSSVADESNCSGEKKAKLELTQIQVYLQADLMGVHTCNALIL